MKSLVKILVIVLSTASMLSATLGSVTNAAMISTRTAIAMDQRAAYIEEVERLLARESVREKLVELGVNPEDAIERIAAMTTEELQVLNARMHDLPAGGMDALTVIGIVFLVLIILELVGITNVFTKL